MELELILKELWPVELSHFRLFCVEGYEVCVINSSGVSRTWQTHLDIMKTCMCDFDGARTNFDRITAFEFVILGIFCMAGYGVCVINSSYSF